MIAIRKKTRTAPLKESRPPTTEPLHRLRVIPLGGTEEVGRNMTVFEYGEDIIIVDMGLQFPEDDMPGIDYIVPNISYLKGKEKNIRGVIITHGHMDHIGAVPNLIPKLGNPTIYCSKMTRGLIEKRSEEYQLQHNFQEMEHGSIVKLGAFTVQTLHINHSIPGSFIVSIKTPAAHVVHTGDFKFDHSPVADKPADLTALALKGHEGVDALFCDSTDATKPGFQISEYRIAEQMEEVIEKATGRIIIAMFSTMVTRFQSLINIAEKHGRYVAIDGRSLRNVAEVAHRLGYLKINKGTLIPIKDINRVPNNKVMIIATGAQGEDKAVLMRITNKEHKNIAIEKDDLVVFSSSIVPGNERSVAYLMDSLIRQGAKVLNVQMMDVHAGGHAKQEDIKLMVRLMNPKFYIPVEQHYHALKAGADTVKTLGYTDEQIMLPENGKPIEFWKDTRGDVHMEAGKEKVPTDYVMIDGLGAGDVSEVVIRDRQMLAADGIFVVIMTVDRKGELTCNPHIISRGFIHLDENKKLLNDVRNKIRETLRTRDKRVELNSQYIKNKIRNEVGQFLYKETERRPMVLPVIIEV